jgi:hypothetical protein
MPAELAVNNNDFSFPTTLSDLINLITTGRCLSAAQGCFLEKRSEHDKPNQPSPFLLHLTEGVPAKRREHSRETRAPFRPSYEYSFAGPSFWGFRLAGFVLLTFSGLGHYSLR